MIIGMNNFYVILWIKKIVLKVLCIKKDVKNVNIKIINMSKKQEETKE